jgi:high affinity Mn2+ porin
MHHSRITESWPRLTILLAVASGGIACFHAAFAQSSPTPQTQNAQAPNGSTTAPPPPPAAATAPAEQTYAIYLQSTLVEQFHPAFASPYRGPQSLDPGARGDETFDATFYGGVRPWTGGEIWLNAEVDQGFGLSDTLGFAAYSNAEGAKVGEASPYPRIPRLFLRQSFDLGGAAEPVMADVNTLAQTGTHDRVVLTIGKFNVTDIFDNNAYAHDSKHDFLNWALVDAAAFDYAADAWGYSYGAASELYAGRIALRAGIFALSRMPNGEALDTSGSQFQIVGEAEEDHNLLGAPGKLRLLGYLTRGRMADFSDATQYGIDTGQPARLAPVRNYSLRAGVILNLEQSITENLGLFSRAGYAEGGREDYEYTDADLSYSAGLSLKGTVWGRADDTVGSGIAINDISRRFKNFLADGGLAILVGDGQLPNSGPETAWESYYSYALAPWAQITADYQFINHPAYNRDRGPVSILGARFHVQY